MNSPKALPTTAVVVASTLLAVLTACNPTRRDSDDAAPGNLTPGMVKLKIEEGKTTQDEIREVFGPPDLLTYKDGRDVWTYDKTSYDFDSHSDFLWVIVAGSRNNSTRSSSRSTMLVLYFDAQDIVSEYRLSSIKY